MKCALRNCDHPYFARGYCQMHYSRMRSYGDPLLVRFPKNLSIEERFWPKVDKTGDCWIWIAAGGRYGHIRYQGRITMAHRVSWEIENGPVPDGMDVLHHCDVPRCVRPDHLFLGTHSDNMQDMRAKGRGNRAGRDFGKGSAHHLAKLSEKDIPEIRTAFAFGATCAQLSRDYHVSWSTINGVVHRKTWTHV